MKLAPYLLDEWLSRFQFADPPIRYDLAASTGPHWTLRQILNLLDEPQREELLDSDVVYCHGSGTQALRDALGDYQGVDPAHIQILTGAIEALTILFFLAAEPGANVVVPFPGFPPFEELPRSFGLEVRQYRLRRENGFRLDLDEVKSLVDASTK
ncbi:MAG: aminotransferase class I/II-fold pyridoxal phosphate-dependent enzyme, partial [Blastocatellia bacterium]